MKLLLVHPRSPESFWSFRFAVDEILPKKRALNSPLGAATLAALCPPHWDVRIVDENVEPLPLDPDVDLVGVCGMGVQFPRQRHLLRHYRQRGYFVVAGGSFASLCPERYEDLADTVLAGECEYIWKDFCRDFENGVPKKLYRETGTVDLADSPVPRFDLLKLDAYSSVGLQFSRGCPFRCEFCDIIVMFGRRPRTKSPEQIGRELDALRTRGVRSAFFVDDNFIGHKPRAKEILRYLHRYQVRHGYPFAFGTEASLNLAQDPELLGLLRDANFGWLFIGIESPDPESLRETGKTQNLREDMLQSIRTIYSHGIDVYAGFIVGFDRDTAEIFDRQYQFIMESGIQVAMIGLLTALPKTPLYERLEREGRLLPAGNDSDNTKLGTNILPKGMTYRQLVEGYHRLYRRLFDPSNIARRVRNKLAYLRNPNGKGPGRPFFEVLGILRRLATRGLARGGIRRTFSFLRSLPFRPRQISTAVEDWILGLTFRDFMNRHFTAAALRRAVSRIPLPDPAISIALTTLVGNAVPETPPAVTGSV